MSPKIVLRYFTAQGRAQALRHTLLDAGVDFDDVRVTVAEWPPHKNDPSFAGPFGSLPTLTWGGVTIAEALPIASFIARKLGHYEGRDDTAIARLEAVSSCLYLDVMLRMGDMLWAEVIYPGTSVAAALPRPTARAMDKLERIDGLLEEGWLGGHQPVVSDFFAAEALELVRYILGSERDTLLRKRLPNLFTHAERIRARPRVQSAWDKRPPTFSASPAELEAVAKVRALDLSAIGL